MWAERDQSVAKLAGTFLSLDLVIGGDETAEPERLLKDLRKKEISFRSFRIPIERR